MVLVCVSYEKYSFDGKILIVGCGSVGQGLLPLLLRHFNIPSERMTIVTADSRGEDAARKYDVRFIIDPLLPHNYESIVRSHIGSGDFLVNVSVDVSSAALIELCQRDNILYVDTVMEPWKGFYTDPSYSLPERSNYALREEALKLRKLPLKGPRSTAVLAHGANPGLVSHFVKEALLNIAADTGGSKKIPETREGWAQLAKDLNIKAIHIAERDTQESPIPKKMGEFINTWSIDGFASESLQPAEMGWGTHEKNLPLDGREHEAGCGSSIYLQKPGLETRVRSWTPLSKAQHAWIITHHESIAIAGIAFGMYIERRNANRLIAEQSARKAENKQKILAFILANGKTQNNEVEGLLGVSRATVERYFDELENEGKLIQHGVVGKSVFYTPK